MRIDLKHLVLKNKLLVWFKISICIPSLRYICHQNSIYYCHEALQSLSCLSKSTTVYYFPLSIAGKTTLLHKVWGIKGERGLFTHTEVPTTYQINNKVYVVDFPGSNSLEYHAKTFSICGAMNNLIILVIPFTGDISKIISEEVTKVFEVMTGSDCTQVTFLRTF